LKVVRMKNALLAVSVVALLVNQASATVWWDTNGTTAGSGATPDGTWSAAVANWGNTAGTAATAVYGADTAVRFSAGTTAGGDGPLNPFTVTVVGTVNVTAMGIEEAPQITFNGGIIKYTHAAAATSILTGVTAATPSTLIINSQISSNANVGFKIARNVGLTNVVSISNTSNDWTGQTAINGDNTLRMLASGVVPDASQVSITAATAGGTLDLNGFNETVAGVQSTGTAAQQALTKVTLGAGTLTVGAPSGEIFAGVISGAGNVVKNGAGAWNLQAVNTYAGDTTVSAGALSVDADATLGNGTGTLKMTGGKLIIANNRSVTTDPIANPVNFSANSEITTSSTAASVAVNFSNASIVGTAGTTVTFRNDGADGAGDVFDPRFAGSGFTLDSNVVIDNGTTGTTRLSSFNTGAAQTFNGTVSGNGSFRRSATTGGTGGTTIFTGNNTYSGGTALNDGQIGFGSDTAIGTGTMTVGSSNNPGVFASGGPRTVANAIAMNNNMRVTGSQQLTLSGNIDLGAGTRTLNVSNTADTILSGVISNGTGLVKDGAGKLILTNANTYGGTTTVNGGTLQIDGSVATDAVVGAAGKLSGNGSIAGALTSAGSVAPGASIGTLNIGASVSLTGGSYDWEFSGGPPPAANAALGADVLNVNGSLAIASTVSLIGGNLGTFVVAGTKFIAISYAGGGAPGTFSGMADDSYVIVGGQQWIINYDDTSLAGAANFGEALYGNAVTLTAVPELSSILTVGLAGVFAFGAVRLGKRFGFSFKV
jgi:fibronectin-binding autotransporter adhesin